MILQTQRLILRKPRLSDWKDVVEGVGDFEVSRNTLRIPYPYTKKDALDWIKKSNKKWNEKRGYTFAIELKKEKKLIGVIDLIDVDTFSGTADTGSWINRKYQRKGYITEAKIVVNEFAFNKLKLRKLNSRVFSDNIASNKVQERIGYKLEGIMKKDVKSLADNKIKDAKIYGLFKEDWKRNLPKLKKRLNDKIKKLKES